MKTLNVSYLRVSTANQREAETIETQRYSLARYFEQNKIKPDFQFEDDGVSGGIEIHKRPQGSQLYRLMSEGRIRRLFVFGLDRIGRDTIDSLLFIRLAETHSTQIIGISDGTDTTREGSTLETEIRTVIAAQYKRDCTRRTKAGLRRRATEGKVSTRAPFGFQVVEGRLAIDETRAKIMAGVFRDVARGLRTKEIVTRLNESGAPSPTGKGWRHDTLIYLLKHRAYAGEYVSFATPKKRPGGGRRIPRDPKEAVIVSCPEIVSPDLFTAVQERLAFNRRWNANGGKRTYMLKSLIRCGRCGLTYVGHSIVGRRYRDRVYPPFRYYECGSLGNRDYEFCRNRRINADRIELAVWSEIECFIETPSTVIEQFAFRYNQKALLDQKNMGRNRKRIETAKSKNLEARDRLIMALARGIITDRDAQVGFDELTREAEILTKTETELQESQTQEGAARKRIMDAEALLLALRKRLDQGLTPEKKLQITQRLVKQAVVTLGADGRATVAVEYVLPSPVCFAPIGSAFKDSSLKK